MMLWNVIFVFSCGFILDLLWALYIMSANRGRDIIASLMSVGVAAPALFGYLAIAESSKWMSVPYFIGLFLGTYVGLKVARKYLPQ
jgi:hypothetical protein